MHDAPTAERGVVTISVPRLAGRAAVRGAPDAIGAALMAFGITVPPAINRAASSDAVTILRLGPDEWLAMSPIHDGPDLCGRFLDALSGAPSSVVDITQRQVAFTVTGPGAADALSAGVPLDLAPAAFPVGMATRTIFDKSEIVLWRREADGFHIEVWRSFAPYVMALLEAARAELAGGI